MCTEKIEYTYITTSDVTPANYIFLYFFTFLLSQNTIMIIHNYNFAVIEFKTFILKFFL